MVYESGQKVRFIHEGLEKCGIFMNYEGEGNLTVLMMDESSLDNDYSLLISKSCLLNQHNSTSKVELRDSLTDKAIENLNLTETILKLIKITQALPKPDASGSVVSIQATQANDLISTGWHLRSFCHFDTH